MKKVTLFIISLAFSLCVWAKDDAPKKLDFTKLEIEFIANENILTESELEAYSRISKEFDEKQVGRSSALAISSTTFLATPPWIYSTRPTFRPVGM